MFMMFLISRSNSRQSLSSDEDTDDAEPLDHDYDLPHVRWKKAINKGRWTKEEVSTSIVLQWSFQGYN